MAFKVVISQLKESSMAVYEPAKSGSADPPLEDAVSELAGALRRLTEELN